MTTDAPIPVGPMPIPRDAPSVLIFGGTFDPPHFGHLQPPAFARDALGIAWLLYVPAARSPHKDQGPFAPDLLRVEMLEAALAELPQAAAAISTIEMNRGGSSYTIDTLRQVSASLPRAALRLLIGADQAAAFHTWREPRQIIALAEPAVMLRAPLETPERLIQALSAAGTWSDAELLAWQARVVEVPLVDADATGLRHALAQHGVDDPLALRCLPQAVRDLIATHGLYASPAPSGIAPATP